MKKYLIYALLIGSLGPLCYGQQSVNTSCDLKSNPARCASANPAAASHGTPAAHAVFGPVLLPQGTRPSVIPKAEPPASQPNGQAAPAQVQEEESLGETVRRFRSQKNQHPSPPSKEIEELGLQ